jgi:adenosylcobinamide-phosphate synthase
MIGKLSQVADGEFYTHARQSAVNLEGLAAIAASLGADAEVVERIRQGNTAREAQEIALAHGVAGFFDRIAEKVASNCPGLRRRNPRRRDLPHGRGRGGARAGARRMRLRPAALLLALGLDLVGGEPANRWHPVAWIGRVLARLEARAGNRTVADGAAAVMLAVALVGGAAAIVAAVTRRTGRMGVLLEALALKPAFAVQRLAAVAAEVGAAMDVGDLDEARRRVGRHLVSRETRELSAAEVTSAAIESLAENLADSVVAPLLAYATGGLPAAWAYRVLNTADAMWGYRDAQYEWFGKVAARLDDLANLVPARLAAVAVVGGAGLVGESATGAARFAWRDHGRTASPNAGWPMAAMAGALGVGLVKPGAYRLGDEPLSETLEVIRRALRVFTAASALLIAVTVWLAALRQDVR